MENNNSTKKLILAIGGIALGIAAIAFFIFSRVNAGLIYVDNDRLQVILDDGDAAFIYVGSPSCPVCNNFRPTVDRVLDMLGSRIYYFETDAAAEADVDHFRELLGRINVTSTPTIIFIENGVVYDMTNSVAGDELMEFFERRPEGLR